MIYGVVGIVIYIIAGTIFGLTLNLLAVEQVGTGDEEFDSIMLDKKMRFFAIFVLSILWVVTLPAILIINIFNREEFKKDD